MYTIKETLAELENEKTEIENKIELVKSFDKLTTADFTEEVYHDFCETPLRGTDILGEKLASVLPFLVLQKGRSNYSEYAFDFKDLKDNKYFNIRVTIPCCSITAVEIEIHKKKSFFTFEGDIEIIEKKIEELEKVLTYSFSQRVEYCGKGFRNWFKPIHYILKHNKKELNNKIRMAIEKEKEHLKNTKARKLKNEIVSREFQRLTDKIVAEYVPQLLEWTKVVTVNAAYDRQRYTK